MNTLEFSTQVQKSETEKMPVLFVGHGNPMLAISDNPYSRTWRAIGKRLTQPKAILCISAHWLTRDTRVTMMGNPKTIHDFYGFPDELFQVRYPVLGAPEYAKATMEKVKGVVIQEDHEWGLDHGAWSVLRNMYPAANIPVYQLSIDATQPAEYHFHLARELAFLRTAGVLVIGSGNVVHNLSMVKWEENAAPYEWALEFDELVKTAIEADNPQPLIEYEKLGHLARLAHPTNDHYLPLMYVLGLRTREDKAEFFNASMDLGSMSMRSVILS